MWTWGPEYWEDNVKMQREDDHQEAKERGPKRGFHQPSDETNLDPTLTSYIWLPELGAKKSLGSKPPSQ